MKEQLSLEVKKFPKHPFGEFTQSIIPTIPILKENSEYDVAAETPMFQAGKDTPLGGLSIPDKNFGFYD